MSGTKRSGYTTDARARVFTEAQVVDYLLVYGWLAELRRGEGERARADACATLERWVAAGLPAARAADGTRRFDPAEVMNFGKWIGRDGADPYYRERFVPRSRALVCAFHPAQLPALPPPSPATLPPRRFTVTLEREFALSRAPAGPRPLLRMPRPLEDATCRDLELACSASPGVAVDFTHGTGRIDARFAADPGRPTLTLTERATFTALPTVPDPQALPLAEADRALYTRPIEGLVNVTPAVQALAQRLAGTEPDPARVVRRFWDYVLDELKCGLVDYAQVDPQRPTEHPLDTGWFDCQISSALLVALCRSRGLPARIVSGYLLYVDSPSIHWWTEVALPGRGWVPMDTMTGDLSAQGRDAGWRDHFFGALDYRMKCECLPRVFNRSPGFRLPDAWRMLWRRDGNATEIGMYACDTGELAYRDRITVNT